MQKARPRTFDYAAFIEECRALIDRARDFDKEDASAYSVAFKNWRRELEDLVASIRKLKYSPSIHSDGRYYHRWRRCFQILGSVCVRRGYAGHDR
jgi:hypothetical protein